MLAAIVLIAQIATPPPPPNPCEDELWKLCRISPYFCPDAYPGGLTPGTNGIPCWPEAPRAMSSGRAPISVGLRPSQPVSDSASTQAAEASPAANSSPVEVAPSRAARKWWTAVMETILP